MMQTDLFRTASELPIVQGRQERAESAVQQMPLAVPCGFLDRANNPCQRLGNWPIMVEGQQLSCRRRLVVHCDPACFRGEAPLEHCEREDGDIIWDEHDDNI
jgi:hypothetical protein